MTNAYDGSGDWTSQLNTYRDDSIPMPTVRLKYLSKHPTTQLANLHTNEAMIAPIWGKVSKSVWASSAKLCGGYGRRLQRSTISCDAPTYFNNPATTYKTEVPPPGRKATITRKTNRVFVENESAYVLPGGKSILSATQASKAANAMYSRRSRTRLYPHENQTLLEHLDPGRDRARTPIDWNYSTGCGNSDTDGYFRQGGGSGRGSARAGSAREPSEHYGNNGRGLTMLPALGSGRIRARPATAAV